MACPDALIVLFTAAKVSALPHRGGGGRERGGREREGDNGTQDPTSKGS